MTLVDQFLHGHLRRRLKLGQFERAKHFSSHDEVTFRNSAGGVRTALIWVAFSPLSLVVKTRLVGNSYFSHFQFCALTVDIIIISHLRLSINATLLSLQFFSLILTFFHRQNGKLHASASWCSGRLHGCCAGSYCLW